MAAKIIPYLKGLAICKLQFGRDFISNDATIAVIINILSNNMNNHKQKIVVLKFGHSVLAAAQDAHKVVACAKNYLTHGFKVIVVVSAIGDTTNQLSAQITEVCGKDVIGNDLAPEMATIISSGEINSAALVTIAFNRVGILACRLPHNILKTDGDILDASPVRLDVELINERLHKYDVLVLPGFIGVNASNCTTLLGRGGSDLSAVFVARTINASYCVLCKDQEIVVNVDVEKSEQIAYSHITFTECLKINYPVIQHKAIYYAIDHQQIIHVQNINNQRQTEVGALQSSYFD